MLNRRADKLELLRIAEAVALEKSIDKELIINSMETGIAKAAKSKFGNENEIKVSINRESGDIELFRKLVVVEIPENTKICTHGVRNSVQRHARGHSRGAVSLTTGSIRGGILGTFYVILVSMDHIMLDFCLCFWGVFFAGHFGTAGGL